MVIDRAELQGRIPLGLGGLVIDRFAVSGPNIGIQMSGVLGRADGFEGLKLDVATTTRMSVRSILAFWPTFVVPDVRAYLVQALQDGVVQSFRYTTAMSPAVLADALEDAGCDSQELLAHCRGGGPHVRGCWAVDLVLGKK